MTRPKKKSSRKSAQPQPAKGAPPTVFVVDDEPMIGEVVEAILQLEGYRTQVFQDPEIALRTLTKSKEKPMVLLTDFVMPGMNGMELIERCKKARPDLKTILFSGNFGEDILRYYAVKPDRFLSKPFQPRALTAVLNGIMTT